MHSGWVFAMVRHLVRVKIHSAVSTQLSLQEIFVFLGCAGMKKPSCFVIQDTDDTTPLLDRRLCMKFGSSIAKKSSHWPKGTLLWDTGMLLGLYDGIA